MEAMMNKYATYFTITALLLTAASWISPAAALDFGALPSVAEILRQAGSAELSSPAPAIPGKAVTPEADWTIMVFMNGKNDLTDQALADINEMEELGPAANMNILIEAGRSPSAVQWPGGRRYLLAKDGDNPEISSELLQNLGLVDMGDWRSLADFGRWAKANYPAKNYMLIVWNHGSGWKMEWSGPERAAAKGISYDDETGRMINPVELAEAVRGMGGVDVYASDACLMQMAEVVYELRDAASIVVGSEESEPEAGWNYREFLGRLHADSAALTPEALAAAAVQGYIAHYQTAHGQVTMSALRTQNLERFRELLDQWSALAMQESRTLVSEASSEVLAFDGSDSVDLLNFMGLVQNKTASAALKAKTAEAVDYFYDNVLLDIGATGSNFKKAGGMAVYLPVGAMEESYKRLAWAGNGHWDEFAQWFAAR